MSILVTVFFFPLFFWEVPGYHPVPGWLAFYLYHLWPCSVSDCHGAKIIVGDM